MPVQFNIKKENAEDYTCHGILTCLGIVVSLIIVGGLKYLLDALDEINEPYIQGELRQRLQIFMYIFTMTFFFGCWCCGCFCGCAPCRYLTECPSATSALLNNLSYKFLSSHPSIRRKLSIAESEMEITDVVVITPTHHRPNPLTSRESDHHAYEHKPRFETTMVQSEASTSHIIPPPKQPLGRLRSYSIDVGYK